MTTTTEARYHAIRARALAAASVEAGLNDRPDEADRCYAEHTEAAVLASAAAAVSGTTVRVI